MGQDFADIPNLVQQKFESQREAFLLKLDEVPSVERYFEIELERLNRNKIEKTPTPSLEIVSEKDIPLNDYYKLGWHGLETNVYI